jgi:DNA-binding transcriptional LysR family regulator
MRTPSYVLVDELHFGRAAERLGISRPAVSEAALVLEPRLRVEI